MTESYDDIIDLPRHASSTRAHMTAANRAAQFSPLTLRASTMSLFFISAALLIAGYFTYGVFVDRLFKPDANRLTPAYAHTDGVDFVPMKCPTSS